MKRKLNTWGRSSSELWANQIGRKSKGLHLYHLQSLGILTNVNAQTQQDVATKGYSLIQHLTFVTEAIWNAEAEYRLIHALNKFHPYRRQLRRSVTTMTWVFQKSLEMEGVIQWILTLQREWMLMVTRWKSNP